MADPDPDTDTRSTLPVTGPASMGWLVALEGVQHPHLARPVDAWHDRDGTLHLRVAVPDGVTLREWADARGPLDPGEAVTVLLPVLAAVGHLRHRGVRVVGLGLGDVLVDARGAPVLARADLDGPGSGSVDDGLAGVLAFVATVLEGVRWPPGAESPAAPLGRASQLVEVVELVHDLAEPLPLATTVRGAASVPPAAPPEPPAPPAWTALLPESEVVDRALAWWARSGPGGLVAGLRAVRPRFWATGVAVLGALVASASLVGDRGADGTPLGDPATRPSAAAAPSGPVTDGPPRTPLPDVASAEDPLADADARVDAGEQVGASGDAGADAGTAVRADDPAAAARVLLRAREECLRELDAACLHEVDHASSPLLGDDLAFLAEPAGAPRESGACTGLTETARWGGSALLRCERDGTTAASVLVVRTEAGWRLREVAPSGGGP
ncbi:serine/threonine-protein kinase [Frigoribacterium salinisoli]